jgi:hypothetical protein
MSCMNKRVINKIKFYTNSQDTKTIVFLPYGRLMMFSASVGLSSIDLAISILLFKSNVNENNSLSHYEMSLNETKVG